MKTWKKNMLASLILLVVCAGIYTNWLYTNSQNVNDLTEILDAEKVLSEDGLILDSGSGEQGSGTIADYFAAVRLSRQEARDSALTLLQEAMAYGDGSYSEQTGAQLDQIVQTALCEAQIESLIIAKGYTDCVAYMSDEGISVAVATPEGGMQQTDIAVIADIVMTQTGFTLEQIRVVEVM